MINEITVVVARYGHILLADIRNIRISRHLRNHEDPDFRNSEEGEGHPPFERVSRLSSCLSADISDRRGGTVEATPTDQ